MNVTALETGEEFEFVSALNRLTVNSLNPHSTYVFTVAGETSVGVGPSSMAVTATTLEDGKKFCIQVDDNNLGQNT